MSSDEDERNEVVRNKTPKLRRVGRGLVEARVNCPEDPQWYFAFSDHPLAPFPGNALKWESFVYDDGTTYEGLASVNVPHNKGVMVFGSGTGAGIQNVEPNDKYEGEFFQGFAHGLGTFTSAAGEVYRGEWKYGKRSGCGVTINYGAYQKALKKGAGAEEAWSRTKKGIVNKKMRYGRWDANRLVKEIVNDKDPVCKVNDFRGMLQEMESVLTKARMFKDKPDGDVTHMMRRDANGVPIPLFQDPMHYPHQTMFMAPGPIGQCHPIPNNEALKSQMRLHARNYMRIYNQHNLPYLAKPGDDLFAAARLDHLQRMEKEYYRRRLQGQDEEGAMEAVQKEFNNPIIAPEPEEVKKAVERPKSRRQEAAEKRAASRGRAQTSRASAPEREDEIDDDDLIASSSGLGASGREAGRDGQMPTVFCHLGGASQRLTRFAQDTFASGFLPRLMRRKPLGEQ